MLKSMINPDSLGTHTKLIFTFLFFIFLSTNVFAQYTHWVSRYSGPASGNDNATSIAVDGLGNVYVTGNSAGNGTGWDCVTIKYNSNGDTVWVRRYNGPANNSDIACKIGVDDYGNVYIAGSSVGSGTGWDYLTIKYNSAGVQQWIQSYNGPENRNDEVLSMAVDKMGNVHVTGYRTITDTTSTYETIKYNSAGVQQWIKSVYEPGWKCIARSIGLDSLGNVYVTGETGGNFPLWQIFSDYCTVKYNSEGVLQWMRKFNDGFGYAYSRAYTLAVEKSGNVYVAGFSDDYNLPPSECCPFIVKYNSVGTLMWWESCHFAYYLAVDNLGYAYTAGYDAYYHPRFSIGKLRDIYPYTMWLRYYGTDYSVVSSIVVDDSANVYVTGRNGGNNSSANYGTVKYNTDGVRQWAQIYNGTANGKDGASSIALDNLGNVYVTGSSAGIGTGSDYATIRYSPTPPHTPFAPSLVSPLNNAIGQELSLSLVWNSVEFAEKYRVQLALDNSFSNIILDDSTLTDTIKSVTNLSPLTFYYWRVSAKNILGSGPFSSVWCFKTKGAPTQVNLLYPPNNSTNIPINVNLIWSTPGAQTFSIRTLKNNYKENRVINKYWFELTTDTSGTPLIIDTTLTDTTKFVTDLNDFTSYYWHVKAKNEIGWGIFSPWFKFTTEMLEPDAPELVYPENYATLVELNPLLDWDSLATAESYRAQISEDLFFINVVYDSSNIAVTEYQIPNNGLEINTTYYWRVNATNTIGTGPWSVIFEFTTGTTNISGNSEIPKKFRLYNSYPNPFNPSTKIKLDIPKSSYVNLIVYDILGREMTTLVNEKLNAGRYDISWDGSSYPSGVYFYKMITGEYVSVKKMLLIK